jgi:hypothetical protein
MYVHSGRKMLVFRGFYYINEGQVLGRRGMEKARASSRLNEKKIEWGEKGTG